MLKKTLFILLIYNFINAYPPINLFRPSDRFLMPTPSYQDHFQFTVGYEGAVKTEGFQDTFEDENPFSGPCIKRKACNPVNILQIYQTNQNGIAAFKGLDSDTKFGQFSQIFNINDENKNQGIFVPKAKLLVPFNFLFSARFNWCYYENNFTLGLHLPYLSMELKDVRWLQKGSCESVCESKFDRNLIKMIKKVSDIDLDGWKRTGPGDFLAQMVWLRDFEQDDKPFLSNVRVNTRLGLNFPTGLKQDENKLLAVSFGNDGCWGIEFAAGLDLTFCDYLKAGIDVDFLYLFGNTRCRRIKTDCNQTDLLFLNKVTAYKEYGLNQQYNLYLESLWCGTSFKVNYQYLRGNESKLFLCNDKFDSILVNNAESLQEWTTHSLIFGLTYDYGYYNPDACTIPAVTGWFKWGFNGKRAILADTLGLTFTLSF